MALREVRIREIKADGIPVFGGDEPEDLFMDAQVTGFKFSRPTEQGTVHTIDVPLAQVPLSIRKKFAEVMLEMENAAFGAVFDE